MTPDRVTVAVMKQTDLDDAGAQRVRTRRREADRCEECSEKDPTHRRDCGIRPDHWTDDVDEFW
jgi:hypothetical protein